MGEAGLVTIPVAVAAPTSKVAAGADFKYLAFWRVFAQVSGRPDSVWRHLERRLQGDPCYFYIPAFSWRRVEIQQLGLRLTQAQPVLDLHSGPHPWGRSDAPLQHAASFAPAEEGGAESSSAVSQGSSGEVAASEVAVWPVLLGAKDARILAHFIYLALEAEMAEEDGLTEYEIEPRGEELVFIPAVRDARLVQDAGWRLLIREFDSLVA